MKFRVILILLLLVKGAMAHDLVLDVEFARPEVIVAASYDLGAPASGADIRVSSPDNATTSEFVGVTDRDGEFRFAPSVEGQWLVELDDGFGHREQRVITVAWADSTTAEPEARDMLSRASTGLVLIFGVTALFAWGRKRSAKLP